MPTSRTELDDHRVHAFEALKGGGQKDALELLQRIAQQVRPIMQKRKWRVGVLKGNNGSAEFVFLLKTRTPGTKRIACLEDMLLTQ